MAQLQFLRLCLLSTVVARQQQCLRPPPGEALPIDDRRLMSRQARAAAEEASAGAPAPEQVHLIGGSPDKVGIVWALNLSVVANGRNEQVGVAYCKRLLSTSPCDENRTLFAKATGPWNYTSRDYASPSFLSAKLEGLRSSTSYQYRISGDTSWRTFRTPPAVGEPVSFGVVADLGQTNFSLDTMHWMQEQWNENGFDAILFPGDLSYADGFGPRWDSFGNAAEELFSQVPTAYSSGNHEVDNGENFKPFLNRYPALHLAEDSASSSDLYYSFEVGLAHVIMLCDYCIIDKTSKQFEWLLKDLTAVNRSLTPWLILGWHKPWYTSNGHHTMEEANTMRLDLEDLLHKAEVDLALNGHVHAYERTTPVYRNKTMECGGTVFLTIGDGGNREGYAYPWVTPETPAPPLYDQPEWSVKRRFSFGHSRLRLWNSTHAEWQWFENSGKDLTVSDHTWFLRGAARPDCQSDAGNTVVV